MWVDALEVSPSIQTIFHRCHSPMFEPCSTAIVDPYVSFKHIWQFKQVGVLKVKVKVGVLRPVQQPGSGSLK